MAKSDFECLPTVTEDRAWFAIHQDRTYRLRPVRKGEPPRELVLSPTNIFLEGASPCPEDDPYRVELCLAARIKRGDMTAVCCRFVSILPGGGPNRIIPGKTCLETFCENASEELIGNWWRQHHPYLTVCADCGDVWTWAAPHWKIHKDRMRVFAPKPHPGLSKHSPPKPPGNGDVVLAELDSPPNV